MRLAVVVLASLVVVRCLCNFCIDAGTHFFRCRAIWNLLSQFALKHTNTLTRPLRLVKNGAG